MVHEFQFEVEYLDGSTAIESINAITDNLCFAWKALISRLASRQIIDGEKRTLANVSYIAQIR